MEHKFAAIPRETGKKREKRNTSERFPFSEKFQWNSSPTPLTDHWRGGHQVSSTFFKNGGNLQELAFGVGISRLIFQVFSSSIMSHI